MNMEKVIEGYLDKNSKKTNQPVNISLQLKDHQLTMLKQIEDIENETEKTSDGYNKGVIADTVGSGKSIIILAAIQNNPKYVSKHGHTFKKELSNNWWGNSVEYKDVNLINSNLLVVPHNIYYQWLSYINDFTKLSVYQISRQSNILPREERNEYSNYDIVLCKSTQYHNLMETFSFEEDEILNENFFNFYEKYNVYQIVNEITKYQKEIFSLPRYDLCKTIPKTTPAQIEPSFNIINDINKQFYEQTKKLNNILSSFDYSKFVKEYHEKCREIKDIKIHKGDIWCRVIFDEADSISIPNCLESRAYFTWFITSSIKNLLHPNGSIEENISGLHHNGYIKKVFSRIYFRNKSEIHGMRRKSNRRTLAF